MSEQPVVIDWDEYERNLDEGMKRWMNEASLPSPRLAELYAQLKEEADEQNVSLICVFFDDYSFTSYHGDKRSHPIGQVLYLDSLFRRCRTEIADLNAEYFPQSRETGPVPASDAGAP